MCIPLVHEHHPPVHDTPGHSQDVPRAHTNVFGKELSALHTGGLDIETQVVQALIVACPLLSQFPALCFQVKYVGDKFVCLYLQIVECHIVIKIDGVIHTTAPWMWGISSWYTSHS